MSKREDRWGPGQYDGMEEAIAALVRAKNQERESFLRTSLSDVMPAWALTLMEDPRYARIVMLVFGVKVLNLEFDAYGFQAYVVFKRGKVTAAKLFTSRLHFT